MSLLHPRDIIGKLLQRGLSQDTIATLAGTTQPTISRVYRGLNPDPQWSLVQGLNLLHDAITKAEKLRSQDQDGESA